MRSFMKSVVLILLLAGMPLSSPASASDHKSPVFKISKTAIKGIRKIHRAMGKSSVEQTKAQYADLLRQDLQGYDKAVILQDLAMFDFNHKDNAGALVAYQQTLALGDSVPPALRENVELGVAQLYASVGKYDAAVEAAKKLSAKDSGYSDQVKDRAGRFLADAYVLAKDYSHALEVAEKRMKRPEVQRDFAQMNHLLQVRIAAYEGLGEYLKAKDLISTELDKGPNRQLCGLLVEVYEKMGATSLVAAQRQAEDTHASCKFRTESQGKLKLGF